LPIASASIAADPRGTGSLRYSTSEAPSGPDQAANGVPGTTHVDGGTARQPLGGASVTPWSGGRPPGRHPELETRPIASTLDESASFKGALATRSFLHRDHPVGTKAGDPERDQAGSSM
jgi:hypothetical protein